MPIRIQVTLSNVLATPADVLALKFAQQLYGLDSHVATALGARLDREALPNVGESLLLDGIGVAAAKEILFVGVEPLGAAAPRRQPG
ncbi:MAG TPA: hypothetical protein VKE96_00775 [Vicinamibacterales bacterium]|nr:hypothetical protein [Vicinamibacterales bacterium]